MASTVFKFNLVAEYVESSRPLFSVGEFFDGNMDLINGWLRDSQYSSPTFDFPTYFRLRDSVRANKFDGLNYGLVYSNSSLGVTFVGNHDIDRTDIFGNEVLKMQGYAYILSHPGVPCIFWNDYMNSQMNQPIKKLIALRREVGINSISRFVVDVASGPRYAAYITGQSGSMAMKIGSADWSPPDQAYKLRTFGNNYSIWTRLN